MVLRIRARLAWPTMGHVELAGVGYHLPDGRVLLDDVSFRVGEGAMVALVGPNGSGKTTLLRIIAGDLVPSAGSVSRSGGLGVMRQFIGSIRDSSTVRDLLFSLVPTALRGAVAELDRLELQLMEEDSEQTQLRYAQALVDYADAGGYKAEVIKSFVLDYSRLRSSLTVNVAGGDVRVRPQRHQIARPGAEAAPPHNRAGIEEEHA